MSQSDKFLSLCDEGTLDEIKHIEKNVSKSDSLYNTGFELACYNGHIETAKWLLKNGANFNTIPRYKCEIFFKDACKYNNIYIAKFLESLGVNIHYDSELSFRYACAKGHLDIIKWLHTKGVNFNVVENDAFLVACGNGRVDVIDYLYNNSDIDLHQDNDLFLRKACEYSETKVVDWFFSKDKFNVKPTKTYSKEINDMLEDHCNNMHYWNKTFGFHLACTKKLADIIDYDYDKKKYRKEYTKTFKDMFPFSH